MSNYTEPYNGNILSDDVFSVNDLYEIVLGKPAPVGAKLYDYLDAVEADEEIFAEHWTFIPTELGEFIEANSTGILVMFPPDEYHERDFIMVCEVGGDELRSWNKRREEVY